MGKNHPLMTTGSPLDVVCAIILHKDRILVTRRDNTGSFPLHWEFPGGKIEPGESGETALLRELDEELQLRAKVLRAMDPALYKENGHHIRLIPYLCQLDQELAPVPLDHGEIRWIARDELSRLTWAPADIPLVDQLVNFLQ
jgi:8-oxo-dGTP diphosphatase